MSESPYCVTHRRKVHRRDCTHARRIAFPSSWLPEVRRNADVACQTCLDGDLPTGDEPSPLDVGCSQCHTEPGEDCLGDGEGYHLSRWDRLADRTPAQPHPPVTEAEGVAGT